MMLIIIKLRSITSCIEFQVSSRKRPIDHIILPIRSGQARPICTREVYTWMHNLWVPCFLSKSQDLRSFQIQRNVTSTLPYASIRHGTTTYMVPRFRASTTSFSSETNQWLSNPALIPHTLTTDFVCCTINSQIVQLNGPDPWHNLNTYWLKTSEWLLDLAQGTA